MPPVHENVLGRTISRRDRQFNVTIVLVLVEDESDRDSFPTI
jgi:hypothetical protein